MMRADNDTPARWMGEQGRNEKPPKPGGDTEAWLDACGELLGKLEEASKDARDPQMVMTAASKLAAFAAGVARVSPQEFKMVSNVAYASAMVELARVGAAYRAGEPCNCEACRKARGEA